MAGDLPKPFWTLGESTALTWAVEPVLPVPPALQVASEFLAEVGPMVPGRKSPFPRAVAWPLSDATCRQGTLSPRAQAIRCPRPSPLGATHSTHCYCGYRQGSSVSRTHTQPHNHTVTAGAAIHHTRRWPSSHPSSHIHTHTLPDPVSHTDTHTHACPQPHTTSHKYPQTRAVSHSLPHSGTPSQTTLSWSHTTVRSSRLRKRGRELSRTDAGRSSHQHTATPRAPHTQRQSFP